MYAYSEPASKPTRRKPLAVTKPFFRAPAIATYRGGLFTPHSTRAEKDRGTPGSFYADAGLMSMAVSADAFGFR